MNYRVVLNLLGKILLIEAAFMALPILVALLYGDPHGGCRSDRRRPFAAPDAV